MAKDKFELPAFPFKHRVELQIRFNDFDLLGHLNNSIYFEFFDLGKTNYFETVKGSQINWGHADIVIANVNCNFLVPIYPKEHVAVETQVDHFGNKSFVLVQQIINTETREVKSVCRTVMVGFDTAAGTSAPISPEWRSAISAFEGREM